MILACAFSLATQAAEVYRLDLDESLKTKYDGYGFSWVMMLDFDETKSGSVYTYFGNSPDDKSAIHYSANIVEVNGRSISFSTALACAHENRVEENQIISVNGQSIRSSSICKDMGSSFRLLYFSVTSSGQEFIVNEFRKSLVVDVQFPGTRPVPFLATGFIKAWENVPL